LRTIARSESYRLKADFIIIGAGIAAASAAYWLAKCGKVVLLEQESQPGYHSTGRSAALFMESYGTPQVRALTRASRAFLQTPPQGFAEHAILTPRGAMMVACPGEQALLQEAWDEMRANSSSGQLLSAAQACALVPVLRPEQVLGAVYEPDASDIDVHALHQGYLRGAREHGGQLVCNAKVTRLERIGTVWQVYAGGQLFEAPVILNAAGAWADAVASLAGVRKIGLQPKRRSAFIFAPPSASNSQRWPMVGGLDETWYIKPDAGLLLGSPANVDPVEPHDVQAEELDVAMGIHRIGEMTTLEIRRPSRVWAGLRSFVADGDLVCGFDPAAPGFFWVAAQGGYGIQTSAAMGQASAALASGHALPEALAKQGLSTAMLSPERLWQPPTAT
jgi:D-arginine dehydrogenase